MRSNINHIIYLLSLFVLTLDSYIVIVLFSGVSTYYSVDAQWGVWLVSIYSLFYSLVQPVSGDLLRTIGYKKMLMIGLLLLLVGSLLSMISPSFWMLLIFRAISALGAGVLYPTVISYLNYSIPQHKKGTAFGLAGFIFSFSAVITPIVAGIIIDTWYWQLTMLITIIPALTCLLLAFCLPNIKYEGKHKIDVLGIITLVTISLLIMIALTIVEPNQLIRKNIIPVLLMLFSIALIFVFIRIERRAINPVLKIDYFNNRNLLLVFIICILFGMLFSASFLIPIHAEWIFGLSFGKSASMMTLFSIGMALTSFVGGFLVDRWNARLVMIIGLITMTIPLSILTFIHEDFYIFIVLIIIFGLGSGLLIGAPLTYIISKEVSPLEMGTVVGILNIMRSIGMIVGPLVYGMFLDMENKEVLEFHNVYLTASKITIFTLLLTLLYKDNTMKSRSS